MVDGGGAAAGVGQVEETAEVALDDLGVGAVGAFAAVARDFEGVARGLDDPGGVGVAQSHPLLGRGRSGGLRAGELRGDESAGGQSCDRSEQGQTSTETCHESSRDTALTSLSP